MAYPEVKYKWTNEDWGAADKAKDIKTDPKPLILLTPYGLSPFQFYSDGVEAQKVVIKDRVYAVGDASKQKLTPQEIQIGAMVMVPLEIARFGQPGLRNRFFVTGEEYVPVPADVSGSTLDALCLALYETKKPEFDLYHVFSKTKPVPGQTTRVDKTNMEWIQQEKDRKDILSKLVGHWDNTDYHFEVRRKALTISGDLKLPLEGEGGSSVGLKVVLKRSPPPAAPKPIAPQNSDAGNKSSVGVGNQTPGSTSPAPPFDKLLETRPKLVKTLLDSHADRKRGEPLAAKAFANTWDEKKTMWEILGTNWSWQDLNTMVRVFDRIEKVDKGGSGDLWTKYVKYIERAYTGHPESLEKGGIYSLEVTYSEALEDPARPKLTAYLNSLTTDPSSTLAKESAWAQCMHDGTAGWREANPKDQLHISVSDGSVQKKRQEEIDKCEAKKKEDEVYGGGAEGSSGGDPASCDVPEVTVFEDIHIDETSFTKARNPDGTTDPAWGQGPQHFIQSQLKMSPIIQPFRRLKIIVEDPNHKYRAKLKPETATKLDNWAKKDCGVWAVQGQEGHDEAIKLWRQILDDQGEDLDIYGHPIRTEPPGYARDI
ncbi:MAG: hypothetical protein U0271_38145 [Polyangiaceae bacterium]